ncbi:hypothetical protein ACLMJK_002610 [Lecanora helva]
MATLDTLPPEIIDQIFSYLGRHTLHKVICTGPALCDIAAIYLYREPIFATSYRFAQFVTTVSHSRRYADLVRDFKLSEFCRHESAKYNLARWIEWKYKKHPVYRTSEPSEMDWKTCWMLHRTRCKGLPDKNIPVGLIIQVLAACRNLRKVELRIPNLDNDRLVKSLSPSPPATLSNRVFESEIGRSWTYDSRDVQPVYHDAIIAELPNLPHLEELQIRSAVWLTQDHVETILSTCPKLENINLRGSGDKLGSSYPYWATKGREKIVKRLTLCSQSVS